MTIKTLENGGVTHLKTQKKIQIWWGHTSNPKPKP